MKALISPNENNRICQVEEIDFPVAKPLFWDTCPDDCTPNWTYIDGKFEPPVPPIATAEENKQTAMILLSQTDWVNQPDVTDITKSPYLTNKSEFDSYRLTLRQIAVYPVEGNIDWPVKPQELWSK